MAFVRMSLRCIVAVDSGKTSGLPADDVFDDRFQRQLADRPGNHMPAVAEDRCAVGDAHDLVHPVRDINDRHALGLELCQEGEDFVDIVSGKRRASFVEIQNPGSPRNRLEDFGKLSLSRPKIAG